jgi:hypothetical protein
MGSSTFALKTPTGSTVANQIGSAISPNAESYARNALKICDIPKVLFPTILSSELLVLQLGVMEFLPSLRKRLYPCLAVQSKNGFLYDIEHKRFPALARVLNSYNRVCFNAQLKMNLCINDISGETLKDFVTGLHDNTESKIERIFLISPPPITHPLSEEALNETNSVLQNLEELFRNVKVIDYTVLTIGLQHDKSGHLIESDREIFASRLVSTIEDNL